MAIVSRFLGSKRMNSLPCFGLQDKVVVVTGAGRGIGRAIALDAYKSGAKVAVGSRTSGELDTLANEIIEAGGECFAHTLDVTDVSSINTFMSAVIEHYGGIDVPVNIMLSATNSFLSALTFSMRIFMFSSAAVVWADTWLGHKASNINNGTTNMRIFFSFVMRMGQSQGLRTATRSPQISRR